MYKITGNGIQAIVPGLSNVSGINSPLITFDSLVDTDFGLLTYINKKFLDTSVFDIDFFKSNKKIRDMIKALIGREKRNPLLLCIRNEFPNREKFADDLYSEFMSTEELYGQIMQLSMYTGMCDFLKLAEKIDKGIRPIIVCRREIEKEFVKEHITKVTPVTMIDKLDSDIVYQQFFFRYVDDPYTSFIQPLIGKDKTIYLANYRFNYIDNLAGSEFIAEITSNYCRLSMYDVYNKEELYDNQSEGGR